MKTKTALLIVDVQNDFCSGGSLAVPDAEDIIPLINRLQPQFDIVIVTKDWHPSDHMSFEMLWPKHCVQGTYGAELHSDLQVSGVHKCIHKGDHQDVDSYSAFYDNDGVRSTGLTAYLRQEQVEALYVVGLATDYCVKFSALDAIKEGFKVYVIEDACRGVELQPGDVKRALEDMRKAGVVVVRSGE